MTTAVVITLVVLAFIALRGDSGEPPPPPNDSCEVDDETAWIARTLD